MIEEKYVKLTGPSHIYNRMDEIANTIRRAEGVVEELEEIKTRRASMKEIMAEEVEGLISELEMLSSYLDYKPGREAKKEAKMEMPKAPKVVKKVPETKPILKSVRIKPKKDAEVEKQKKQLKSSIKDLKGELERLKKEIKK